MRVFSASSLFAQRQLGSTQKALARAIQRLSSGQRINSAKDDAAGLAMSSTLESQRRGTLQSIRNINDASGILETADGAISEQMNIVQRIRELAVQGANGILSNSDRSKIDLEVQQLYSEFERITNQTTFNGTRLLDGSLGTINLQMGSGKQDSLGMSINSNQPSAIFQKTVGTSMFNTATTLPTGAYPRRVKTADMNGDNILDLVSLDDTDHTISIRIGVGDGTFGSRTTFTIPPAYDFDVGDITGDGLNDIVVAGQNGATISIYKNLSNRNSISFGTATTVTDENVVYAVTLADMNHDGKLDIVSSDPANKTALLDVFLGNGNGSFQNYISNSTGIGSLVMAAGQQMTAPVIADFNGDGILDAAVGFYAGFQGNITIMTGSNDGHLTPSQNLTMAAFGVTALRAGDLNGDGKMDLVADIWTGATTYDAVYMGTGAATFTAGNTYAGGTTSNDLQVQDLDGDGKLDIISGDVTGASSSVSIQLGNGDGTFATRKTISTGSNPISIAVGDLNGDGVNDLVTANSSVNSLSIHLQLAQNISAVGNISVSSQANAQALLKISDNALRNLNSARSTIGGLQNRMQFAADNATLLAENYASAKSNILDADVASETAELLRSQILQQAQVAILGQSNLQLQMVLQLLRPLA